MVEHGRIDPVVGLAFDGLGYGTDGTMWGGEFLVAGFDGFTRVGHLRCAPMPGGVAAIREPWRMAAAWAQLAGMDPTGLLPDVDPAMLEAVTALASSGRALVTSSMGRLFDAIAALLGCRRARDLRSPSRDRARGRGAHDQARRRGGILRRTSCR